MTLPPFQRFLDAHRDDVWRFLVAAVGRQAADDVFQETFLAALQAYPKARPTSPRAWVLAIAHHKVIDAARARQAGAVPVGDAAAPELAGVSHDALPSDNGVWERVRELPSKQRAAVLLRYAGDLSHREIAVVLGGSEAAARRSTHDGLQKLRQEMAR